MTMAETGRRRGSCLGRLLKFGLSAAALVIAVLFAWGLVNVPPPSAPVRRDHLTDRDIDLVLESRHLRASLGERIWPGFGDAALPLQLYNDGFGFLLGAPAPAEWEEVTANRIDGQPYYRRAHPERQAFAVRIGGRWAGSIATKESADAGIPRMWRQKTGPLARLVPYRLVVPSTDQYVGFVLHEQFHAFQAERDGRRFERAVASYAAQSRYPWDDTGLRDAWMKEIGLLLSALDAPDRSTQAGLVAQFIEARRERRERLRADAGTLGFERELEWLEGLAKYVELESWRRAAGAGYAPLPGIRSDPRFHDYRGYQSQWRTERMNMRIRANLHGDLPFYYSGALQAMLLDRVEPAWKVGFLESDLSLDDLLSRAIARERR